MINSSKTYILYIFSALKTNVALKKTSKQSSTAQPTDYYGSHLANDGILDQKDFLSGGAGCAHTGGNSNFQWWAVDLRNEYLIESITVYNREDCCGM